MKFIVSKLSFFFFFLVLVSSCKKDPADAPVKDLKSKMVGEWKYEKLVEKEYSFTGTLLRENSFATTNGEYYNFKEDGTAVQYFNQVSNETFKITAENRFEINTGSVNPCRVERLSENIFVFIVEGPRRDNSEYREYTHFLKR